MLLFYREAMIQRISAVITPARESREPSGRRCKQTGSPSGRMVEQFERVVPKSQAEISVVQQRLIRAGYRKRFRSQFLLWREGTGSFDSLLCWPLLRELGATVRFLFTSLALGLGFLAARLLAGQPDHARQTRIRLGLPDVLDLLVICIEAGLSLDQAIARTAEELSLAQPADLR